MVSSMKLEGVFAALLTPLSEDGSLDPAGAHDLTEHLVGRGVHGLVPLGTTGEFCELLPPERRELAAAVVAAARGRVPVLAGVSGLSTTDTQAHVAELADSGVDGVLVLPPLYWKLDEEGLYRHFRQVAETAAGLPVVLYDFPALTGCPLPAGLVRRLAVDEPRIIGIKLTVRDSFDVTGVLRAVKPERPDFAVVPGFEDLLAPTVWGGGDGMIGGMANFCPELLVSLYRGLREGADVTAPLAELARMFEVYTLSAPPVLGLKAAGAELGVPIRPITRIAGADPAATVQRARAWAARQRTASASLAAAGTATAATGGAAAR
jgi:2-dehydro-3-deoxy-D-pentonate aldolase